MVSDTQAICTLWGSPPVLLSTTRLILNLWLTFSLHHPFLPSLIQGENAILATFSFLLSLFPRSNLPPSPIVPSFKELLEQSLCLLSLHSRGQGHS